MSVPTPLPGTLVTFHDGVPSTARYVFRANKKSGLIGQVKNNVDDCMFIALGRRGWIWAEGDCVDVLVGDEVWTVGTNMLTETREWNE